MYKKLVKFFLIEFSTNVQLYNFLNLANAIEAIYRFGKNKYIDGDIKKYNINEKIIPFVKKINDDIHRINVNNTQSDKIYSTENKKFDEFYDCIKFNIWIEYFNKIRNNISGKNWIDFEKEISNVIKNLVERRNYCLTKEPLESDYFEYLNELCKIIKNFLDANSELTYGNLRGCLVSTINKDQIDDILSVLLKDLNRLTRALDIYISYFIGDIAIENKVDEIQNINPDYVLSFNYSDTYERKYGSQKNIKQYCYIHGKADVNHTVENCNLILGIDEFLHGERKNKELESLPFKKFYQRIYKSPDNHYLDWVDEIKDGYTDYIKRQENNKYKYEQEIKNGSVMHQFQRLSFEETFNEKPPRHKVYIFGHSLDETDKDILKLFICNDNVETKIYYYRKNEDDKEALGKIIQNLIKIMGQKELIRRTGGVHKTIEFIPQRVVSENYPDTDAGEFPIA